MLPEVQLYHYKARVYDPKHGRFLQTDPIGYEDDLNLYAYVGNDPIGRKDPTGKAFALAWPVAAWVGKAAARTAIGIVLIAAYKDIVEPYRNESEMKPQPAGHKDNVDRITGGKDPDRVTSTGNKIYDSPPTGESADDIMKDIRESPGASSETKDGPRGSVEVVSFLDESQVVDRNSTSGGRTIETNRKTEGGKPKTTTKTRFPKDRLRD